MDYSSLAFCGPSASFAPSGSSAKLDVLEDESETSVGPAKAFSFRAYLLEFPTPLRKGQTAAVSRLDRVGGMSLIFSVSANLSMVKVSMNCKYDIFKKTDNSVVWVEAVEDIVAAKKRLISLSSTTPGEYKLWDSSRQEFINPMDECA
jgi:hypothetical protein